MAVWVRASINGQWTDAAVITIHLRPDGDPLDRTFGNGGTVTTAFGNDSDYGFPVASLEQNANTTATFRF